MAKLLRSILCSFILEIERSGQVACASLWHSLSFFMCSLAIAEYRLVIECFKALPGSFVSSGPPKELVCIPHTWKAATCQGRLCQWGLAMGRFYHSQAGSERQDPSPLGYYEARWHGTHLAGTIAAVGNNSIGVCLIAASKGCKAAVET